MMVQERADAKTSGMIYVLVVQYFFLFGLETGVVMLHNLKVPKSLHNQVAWRIYGRVTQRYSNGSWLYPQIG